MVVLDAGVIIAHLDGDDALHARTEELLNSLAPAPLAASVLTIAECLAHPASRGILSRAERAIEQLGVARIALSADGAAAIATIRSETGLRMPDAVVVHTAELLGAQLATTDRAVARAARHRGLRAHEV
ncbi:type II toxin-antitoxin system VapC family toxin [Agrococcus beijingensis]|uniref:type II toxin-antitoxin system VapC family toxin n=1 Tax=Agrococcus beijingensis TaxID=3068634 RepID=UPI002740BA24|nr:type II toxin-antitoxin system VapC family toxin [Agrococcus sp. REN33]